MKMTSVREACVIGIELGDRVSHACVVDGATGKAVDRFSLRTTAEGFERL